MQSEVLLLLGFSSWTEHRLIDLETPSTYGVDMNHDCFHVILKVRKKKLENPMCFKQFFFICQHKEKRSSAKTRPKSTSSNGDKSEDKTSKDKKSHSNSSRGRRKKQDESKTNFIERNIQVIHLF